jgi:hypothetical protein
MHTSVSVGMVSRRVVPALLAVVVALGAAACGGDDSSSSGSAAAPASTATQPPAATTTPSETPTTKAEEVPKSGASPTSPGASGAAASAAAQNRALLKGDYQGAKELYSTKCASGLTRVIFDTVRGAYKKITTQSNPTGAPSPASGIVKTTEWRVTPIGTTEARVSFPAIPGVQAYMHYESGTWKDDSCSHKG